MKPTISIIAAMSENRVIGKNNQIPWRIKEDLVRLKNLTKDKIVIVGRITYESMASYYNKSGRDMPGKNYLIITSNRNYKSERKNTTIVHSLEDAINLAKQYDQEEIFIIGGAQIFEQALPLADKLYLTIVKGHFEGDAFFPDFSNFKKVIYKKRSKDKLYEYTFLDLEHNL